MPRSLQSEPMVSVLVITYQHAPFIEQCLDRILGQRTTFPIEVLIGEDGSTDGTREICQRYALAHPDRIRLFLHDRQDVIRINGKPTGRANLMALLKQAHGRYIALCEGDDAWTDPLKLEEQVGYLESHAECVMTYHDAAIVDGQGRIMRAGKMPDSAKRDFSSDELIRVKAFVLTLSLVFRNLPILQDLPEEFKRTSSGDNFLTSLLGAHGSGHFMPGIAPAHYREHGRGVWSTLGAAERHRNQVNNYIWMGAYYHRIGNGAIGAFFFDRAYAMIDVMVPWYAIGHRKSYQWFARVMGWFGVSFPR